jgi:hypothetical protein
MGLLAGDDVFLHPGVSSGAFIGLFPGLSGF